MSLPSTAGGIIGWVISTLVMVAIGVFILTRIPPLWRFIASPTSGASQ